VVAGDFNRQWLDVFAKVRPSSSAGLDLVSAYHSYYGDELGDEQETTLYFRSNPKSLLYHFDYCLIPRAWAKHLGSVRLGLFADWVQTGLSDHVPLVVDIRKGIRRTLQ
jgi:hypothetical protein